MGESQPERRQGPLSPGDLHKQEMMALESNIRMEILDFIGFELMRLKDLGENLGIEDRDLNEQISILERALLVEMYKECCRLTPRCMALLYQRDGYEWRR